MKTEFDDQQITDLFDAEANSIAPATVSTETIVGRGRSLKRRRTAVLGTVAVVAASGVAYGSFRALQPGSGQLAVSASTSEPTTGSVETNTTVAETNAADATTDTSIVESLEVSEADAESESMAEETGPINPVAYRDGFLMVNVQTKDESRNPLSTMTFRFTTDGVDNEPIGSTLEVAGFPGSPAVYGDTVLIFAVGDADSHTAHLYWSDDLTTWTEDVIDIQDNSLLGDLTPAMADLIEIELVPSQLRTNGSNWVATVYASFGPTEALMERVGISRNEYVDFNSEGMLVFGEKDGAERTVTPEEMGVTEADLAVFSQLGGSNGSILAAGQRGSTEYSIVSSSNSTDQVVAFGDRFASLDQDGQVSQSATGFDWTPLAIDVGPDAQIKALAPLESDLLVLAASDAGTKSYRVAADGSATLLGDVPLPAGADLFQGFAENQPIFTASTYTDLPDGTTSVDSGDNGAAEPSEFVITTSTYEITLLGPGLSDSEIHYIVRDVETGEVLAENTRPYGPWLDGEEIDGELTVVFTDKDGKPDVTAPVAELEEATSSGGEDVAEAEVDKAAGVEASGELIQLATADGIHWYTKNADNSIFSAVNGDKLIVATYEAETAEAEQTFEVIDLTAVATATSE